MLLETASGAVPRDGEAAWSPAKRAGFRLLASYLVLYTFPFPLTFLPWIGEFIQQLTYRAWAVVARQVGMTVFGLSDGLVIDMTGSGDRTVDYLSLLLMVSLALVVALVWSLADRHRRHYHQAAAWLEVGVRYVLGLTMLSYGIIKVIPSQFSAPSLGRLLQTYGESSPMGLLWTFMGASPAYGIFAGLGEVVGGVLILFRRTRALGALILTGVLANVAMLNYAYDVPVKLYSTQLLLMALGLLALDGRRLAAVFWTNEPAPPAEHRALFRSRRARLVAGGLAALLVGGFAWSTISQTWNGYATWGPGRARSELWGIHDVESFRLDGEERPPLLTDEVRWRTLIVDRELPLQVGSFSRPGRITIQQMDGSLVNHPVELDPEDRTITRLPEGRNSVAEARMIRLDLEDVLHYERPEPGLLVLRGRWQGADLEVRLRERDLSSIELIGRGYHWINEVPYNR